MASSWQTRFFERPKSPPTREKHRALAAAFAPWVRNGRRAGDSITRVIFDGFAGAGRFAGAARRADAADPDDGESDLGSPLLLLRWAEELGRGEPFRFVFAEKQPDNFARLCAALGQSPQPDSAPHIFVTAAGTVELHRCGFESCATKLLTTLSDAPLFSFVDPYGYDGLTLRTLVALANRGDLVAHIATQAVYTKLLAAGATSPRQVQRMAAYLGDDSTWPLLERLAQTAGPAELKSFIAERFRAALQRQVGGSVVSLVELRLGEAFLVKSAAYGAPVQ